MDNSTSGCRHKCGRVRGAGLDSWVIDIDAARPRDAASERSLLCCGSGSGQASGPFACAYRCRDRPSGVDAPARWAHSVGAGFDPLAGHLPMAGCSLCGRFFSSPPRPPAVGPAPSGVKRFRSRRLHPLQVPACQQARQELAEESPNGKVRFRCSGRHHHHLGHHGRSIVALSARTADDGRHRAPKLVDQSCSAPDVVIAGAALMAGAPSERT